MFSSSVQTTYSGPAKLQYNTGKLVLTTTGSGLAIAPVTYPLPTAKSIPSGNLASGISVNDPSNSNIVYQMVGKNNMITSAETVSSSAPPIIFTASGSWTITGSNYTCIGSIIRADGSSFNFNTTQNPE